MCSVMRDGFVALNICIPKVRLSLKKFRSVAGSGFGYIDLQRVPCVQVPLVPRFVLTHYGLQGVTARNGILLFLTRPPKMTDSDYALARYVLLSRPRQLADVHITGELPGREWFETKLVATNPVLVERMQFFEQQSVAGMERANRICS